VFGLCYSTAQQHVTGLMLCKAGSWRKVSVTARSFATKPQASISSALSWHRAPPRIPCHQSPNLLFKPDWLRQPA